MSTTNLKEIYLDLLKNTLIDNMYGKKYCTLNDGSISGEASQKQIEQGSIWPDRAQTMLGSLRMDNLRYCVEYCIDNNIPGDFLEAGVWRGGAIIWMAGILKANNVTDRKIYGADSFEGLPLPDPRYPKDRKDKHHSFTFLSISPQEVRENFRKYNLLDKNIIFIEGFFEESLKNIDTKQLAILRLDGDMYGSAYQTLDLLYDKVSPGGFIINDDHPARKSSLGAKTAVIDFRGERNIMSEMIRIDDNSIFWQKGVNK